MMISRNPDRDLKIAIGLGVAAIFVLFYLIYSGFVKNKGTPASYVSTRETETQRINKTLQSLTAPETPSVSKDVIKSLTAPKKSKK